MSVTAVPLRPTKRRHLVWLWVGILAALVGAWALAAAAPQDAGTTFLAANRGKAGVKQTASGLQYRILRAGKGKGRPTDADVTLVNYTGQLTDGTVFDKSEQPTPLAVTGVVPGFSEALKLMNKGGKYRFWIKPSLGYGDKPQKDQAGKEVIPAKSVLVFDVELVDFLPEAVIRQMQMQRQMMMGGGAGGMPGGGGGEGLPPGM